MDYLQYCFIDPIKYDSFSLLAGWMYTTQHKEGGTINGQRTHNSSPKFLFATCLRVVTCEWTHLYR